MWRETYDAVRVAADGDAAEMLLQAVVSDEHVKSADAEQAKVRLRAIGCELVLPMSEISGMGSKTPRREKLCVLQLQVVSRLLLCCAPGVFDTSGEDDEPVTRRRRTKAKAKTANPKKASKKLEKPARGGVRSEMRELLDRVALLIDSANPPSIAESEDEPSPFHAFLINVLEKHLGVFVPEVFTVLREIYELTEDDELTGNVAVPAPFVPKITAFAAKVGPTVVPSSILSALKNERPSKKRSLASTSDAFKEVQFPGQKGKIPRSSSAPDRRDPLDPRSHKTSGRSGRSTSVTSAPTSTSSVPIKRAVSGPPTASLVSLAAASKKPKSSNLSSSLSKTMPNLVRNVDRKMLPQRPTAPSLSGVAAPSSAPHTSSRFGGKPDAPSVATLSRASIVMRTPDRPQRPQRAQPRILIESSPPLRNPFATARVRRPGAQLPK